MLTPQNPYYTWDHYLREKFHAKVYKVSLDAGFDCPNRDGTLAKGGCTYCDEGSRAVGINPKLSITEQLQEGMIRMKKKYSAQKFIAYFQAFTNTYAPTPILKKTYDSVFHHPDVVGLSISTRPDCVSQDTLTLLEDMAHQKEVWLELGLQTIRDDINQKLNRWHTYAQFEETLARVQKKERIKVCIHVILGLPGETFEDMHRTIDCLSKLPIHGIKLHTFHVIDNTRMAKDYKAGKFSTFQESTYRSLLCDLLEKIPSHVVIQRVTAEAHPAKLISPRWVLDKAAFLHRLKLEFLKRNSYQGYAIKRK
ncbi:MAG: TIGR01212 family radical SAM protein [Deltaproteobacteria bacterium]|nr:TIGR01212 family radical SAM protein [Deltaproteobacteria bacterium]